MKPPMTRALCLAFVLLMAACGYWGRRPVDQDTDIRPNSPVWIWTPGGVEKWHDVFVTYDSVKGIPFDLPLECATCRRSIPLTRVDSMKLGYKPGVQKVVEGAGIVTAALVVEFALCALLDPHSRDSC